MKNKTQNKIWHLLLIIFSIAVVASCGTGEGSGENGGGSTGNTNPPANDTTAPTVSSTNPANSATDIAVNTTVTVNFSEAMDCATLTASTFIVTNGSAVAGSVTCNGSSATFTPSANLNASDDYTATITTGVRDAASNALATDYSWSFTTAAVPAPVAGRYVTFDSYASNLVGGDTNNFRDIFVHDIQTGATTRVSVDSAGAQGNNNSSNPAISADGRYVIFESFASNLVAGDTNGSRDVFVHDRQTGTTTRVSVDSSGNQANSDSSNSVISGDGRYVAFRSSASNLVAGDTNGSDDIFVYDIQTGATTRVSIDSSGNQGNRDSDDPAISEDGRYVAFESFADNLVSGDTNNGGDIFVHDRGTGATTIASVDTLGNPNDWAAARPSISGDGRFVAFQSNATNLVAGDTNGMTDIFVRDRQAILTRRVSISTSDAESNSDSWDPSISGDGSIVVFWSSATNLALNDANNGPDVFMREGGATKWVSNQSNGDSYSYNSSISRDGGYVAFWSAATNLVAGDANGIPDIFVRDATGTVTLISVDSAGVQANGASANPAMN